MRSEIQLSSHSSLGGKPTSPGLPTALGKPDVQVLRVGSFNHPKYGEFDITKATLAEMKMNFDKRVRGVDIAFDYFHDSDKEASGWLTALYLSEDGTELWARVDWTPKAQQKLHERELRYFSPDFAFVWKDPESGVTYKNVLFGGGLTNRPFVKDMAAIVAAEEIEEMKLEELEKKVLKLDEMHEKLASENDGLKKKLAEYEEKIKKMEEAEGEEDEDDDEDADHPDAAQDKALIKKELEKSKQELAETKKKLEEMTEHKKMAEKEAAFTLMLTEGKAVAAQKSAFMKGDIAEFAKLSQPVNLSARGASGSDGKGGDLEDRAIKLAEEKQKADPKLSRGEAISLALKELQ